MSCLRSSILDTCNLPQVVLHAVQPRADVAFADPGHFADFPMRVAVEVQQEQGTIDFALPLEKFVQLAELVIHFAVAG